MTIELLLASSPNTGVVTRPVKPLVGFNFNTVLSTGTTDINVATNGMLAATTSLPGYPQVLWSTGQNLITPNSAINLGKSDFTIEMLVYLRTNTDGYSTFFVQQGAGNQLFRILVGNNATYRGGLVVGAVNSLTQSYYTQQGRAYLYAHWAHIAIVRRAGKASVYIDGKLCLLAVSPVNDYVNPSVDMNVDISSTTRWAINDTSNVGNFLMAEFAIYDKALYSDNFTPSWPFA